MRNKNEKKIPHPANSPCWDEKRDGVRTCIGACFFVRRNLFRDSKV